MLKSFILILPALYISLCISAQNKITIGEASKHVGQVVTICDNIYEGKFLEKSKTQPTFLEMGDTFSKHKITILIRFSDRKNFFEKPETYYPKKDVCTTGKVIKFKGKPHLLISKPTQIQIGTE